MKCTIAPFTETEFWHILANHSVHPVLILSSVYYVLDQ